MKLFENYQKSWKFSFKNHNFQRLGPSVVFSWRFNSSQLIPPFLDWVSHEERIWPKMNLTLLPHSGLTDNFNFSWRPDQLQLSVRATEWLYCGPLPHPTPPTHNGVGSRPTIMPLCGPDWQLKLVRSSTEVEVVSQVRVWQYSTVWGSIKKYHPVFVSIRQYQAVPGRIRL